MDFDHTKEDLLQNKKEQLTARYKRMAELSMGLIPIISSAVIGATTAASSVEDETIENARQIKQQPVIETLANLKTADSLGVNGVVETVAGKPAFMPIEKQISLKQAELKAASILTPAEITSAKVNTQIMFGAGGAFLSTCALMCIALATKRLDRFANNIADFCANKHMDYFSKDKTNTPQP